MIAKLSRYKICFLFCLDRTKSPVEKNAEGEIAKKIESVEERRAELLAKFEEDMRQ